MDIRLELKNYLEYCEFRKELDWKTLKAYRIDLRQYFSFVDCNFPSRNRIEAFVTDLHKKYKPKTIKRKLASIKTFYNFLEEEEIISENPFRKIKIKFKEKQTLPRIIPRTEIEQLLNYMYKASTSSKKHQLWLRDLAVVETCFATGARVSEVSNIELTNVDLESGLIRIMGKGGRERYIQIGSPSILFLLQQYYNENKKEIQRSGYFFINQKGTRFTEQSIRLMLKKYTKLAGIARNITPHMFRHSFATYLIEEGVDISYVKELLGHSSIKTTQIYLHLTSSKKAAILRDLHPRNSMKVGIAA